MHPKNPPSSLSGFDPAKGCQIESTGLLGGLFIAIFAAAYALFQSSVLPGGGPQITDVLGWLPDSLRFGYINRTYFDIAGFVVLGFFFMVNWQFLRTPLARTFSLGVAMAGAWASWQVALGASWFFPLHLNYFAGWAWSRIEVVYGLTLLGLLLPWILVLFHPRTTFVVSPVGWALRTAFFRWVSGLAVFTAVLLVTFQHPFYLNNYYENWRITCAYLYSIYLFFGLPYAFITCLLRGHKFENRSDPNFVLMMLIRRGLQAVFRLRNHPPRWRITNKRIGISIRDLLVKVFFIPLMVTFLYMECSGLFSNLLPFWEALTGGAYWYVTFNNFYGSWFHSLFIVDVALGLIGYASSSRWLDNKSKSVDPTILGWFVTLACYPPFNGVTGGYLPYNGMPGDGIPYAIFQPMWVDVALKTITLLCFTVYVWATTAFGLRFSNLTHRGIITRGPYAIIRHPAYTMKNVAWWCENIRNFHSPWQFAFLAVWNYVYYLRAITEERHLGCDPNYAAYCQRVRYRFIPGIW